MTSVQSHAAVIIGAVVLLGASACSDASDSPRSGGAPSGRWCPSSAHDLSDANPEGLPEADKTDRAYVQLVLVQEEPRIRREFPGVTKVEIEKTSGNVWRRNKQGIPVVEHRDARYQLLVFLDDPVRCPDAPAFIEGVPLRFNLDPSSCPPRRVCTPVKL